MNDDPNFDEYMAKWAESYESANYSKGLAARFLNLSHAWCEADFGPKTHFAKVLEVGAGTGIHIQSIRHTFDEYVMTDLNPPMLAQIRTGLKSDKVRVAKEDATKLSFSDCQFDRVIATHVLEHLPNPHLVLREWSRVLKPGGILSLVLPCDPGLAWRLGRNLGPRRSFTNLGIAYDYWMAREHINSITNLVSLIDYYFPNRRERWHPLRVPFSDANLFYVAHLRN